MIEIFENGGVFNCGLIKNVSIITMGEAKGHGFNVDLSFIQQVLARMQQSANGIAAYYNHPSILANDRLQNYLGKFTNPRIEGDKVIADLNLNQAARRSPKGDLAYMVLNIAKEDPQALGFSIHSSIKKTETGYKVQKLKSVDLVQSPAANPNGLFSACQNYQSSIICNIIQKSLQNDEHGIIKLLLNKNIKVKNMNDELKLETASPANVAAPADAASATSPEVPAPVDYEAIVKQIMEMYNVTDPSQLVTAIEGEMVSQVAMKQQLSSAKTQVVTLQAKTVQLETVAAQAKKKAESLQAKTKMLLSQVKPSQFKPNAITTEQPKKDNEPVSFMAKLRKK